MTITFQLVFAVLEFGSRSMLAWLAVALLPWLIHRWQRRHHRTTQWAAVDLLLAAVRERSRQIDRQQWLLLALRTGILVLVALAAAQPIWRSWSRRATGALPIHHVVVLDRSYSMGCRLDGKTRLDRAKKRARALIESTQPGDAWSVIAWGEKAEDVLGRPTRNPALALSAIDAIDLSHASAKLDTAMDVIAAATDRAEETTPEIARHNTIFFTDLAAVTWSVAPEMLASSESVVSQSAIEIVDVGEGIVDNLAVTQLAVQPSVVLRQGETTVSATLHAFGQKSWKEVAVAWSVDGQQIEQRQIDLSAGNDLELKFSHRFATEGPHTLQLKIVQSVDSLRLDDSRWLVIDVLPQLRVVCLAGKPDVSDDLARALAYAGGTINVERMPIHRLASLDLANWDAVILANVGPLTPRERTRLDRFIRQGGALAIFLGDQSAGTLWNQNEQVGRENSLLPVRVGEPAEAGDYYFDPIDYQHPIVAPFRGRPRAGLLRVAATRYVRLHPNEERTNAETVLKFDQGDLALVVDRWGLGRVAVCALPASLAVRLPSGVPWSTFTVNPAFVPIIRETINYLVASQRLEHRNGLVGEPCLFPVLSEVPSNEWVVRSPSGTPHDLRSLEFEDRDPITFNNTDEVGVYSIVRGQSELGRFAVNLDGQDSALVAVPFAKLPKQLVAPSNAGTASAEATGTDRSLVSVLLIGAVLLLLTEPAVAWLIGREWR